MAEIGIQPDGIFKPADGVTWRDIDGELIVLKLASGEYYSFNDIGRLSWLTFSEGKSVDHVADAVMREYEVAREQAQADVMAFLQGLLENELLVQQLDERG